MRIINIIIILVLVATTASKAQSFKDAVKKFESGEFSVAKVSFQSLLLSEKNNSEVYYYIGRIAFEVNEFNDAIVHFEKAIELDLNNSHYHMWLGHSFGRQAQSASILKQARYARRCRQNYEKAIELAPSNIEARKSILEYYLQAPKIVGGGRDKAENEASMLELLDTASGISAWGNIYSYYEEPEKEENLYIEGIKNYPTLMISYFELFNMYFDKGEYSKAATIATQQLQVNDTTATIYYNLGNAQQHMEKYDEALDSYSKTLELDDHYNVTYYQIGRLAAVSGKFLDIGKEHLSTFILLGNKVGDACLAWAYYRLGTIEEHLESQTNAKASYQQALKFNKDHEQARKALNALK